MYKRILSCLLCLSLVLGMLPVGSEAAQNEERTVPPAVSEMPADSQEMPALNSGAGTIWEIVAGNTLHIYGAGAMEDYESYASAPWTAQQESITAIVVDSGVTAIGKYAFSGLTKAQTVSLPEGITSLGGFCFQNCYALTDILLPESLLHMGQIAFANCTSLEKIRIPEGVTRLPSYLFYNCESLKDVELPASLTDIDEAAFSYCPSLQTISLPSELTCIGEDAFLCSGIVSITLPDKIKSLYNTFRYCDSLTEVNLPQQLETMDGAFQYCEALTQIIIPASVKNIRDYTVSQCPNLKRIIFQGDLPNIALSAFDEITAEVYYPEGNDTWLDIYTLKNYGGELSYFSADITNICDNHSFGQWQIIVPSDCIFYGMKGRPCEHCSAKEIGGMPSTGHFFSRAITPAGQNTAGYTTDICICCGYRVVEMQSMANMTYSDAVLFLQDALSRRQTSITVRYWDTVPGGYEEAKALMKAAFIHNGVPVYGDYIEGHIAAYTYTGDYMYSEGNMYYNTATFRISYRTSDRQEQELNVWLTKAYESLDLEGKSDFEKIKRIYDYVMDCVAYDFSYSRYTAYHALAEGYTVCQGYALLIYRLMLMAGLDCRYITGDAGGPHAWNIVKLDGVYYHVDATWDDPIMDATKYEYFLRSLDTFTADHTRDPEYDTPEFHAAYPCAETDYFEKIGSCGKNADWILYTDGTLVIRGSGAVKSALDWMRLGKKVKKIRIEAGITALEASLFFNFTAVERIDFMGDMPQMSSWGIFHPVEAYYSAVNPSWQGAELNTQGGYITWRGFLGRGECGNNISWEFYDDGTLIFYGSGPMVLGDELAPWLVKYYNEIKNVVIGEGITSVGNSALIACPELISVSFPSTLQSIGPYAFMDCRKLTGITLPEGLEEVGEAAFYYCEKITSLTFPKSLRVLGECAFMDCLGLTEITFKGNAPQFNSGCFTGLMLDAYYPANNATWTEDVKLYYGGIYNWIGIASIYMAALVDSIGFVGETVTFRLEAEGEGLRYQWYLGADGDFAPVGTADPDLTLEVTQTMQKSEVYCVVTNADGDVATSNIAKLDVFFRLQENAPLALSIDYGEIKQVLFTPTADCIYTVEATESTYAFASLYEYNGGYLTSADFTAEGFSLSYRLTAGKPYLLTVSSIMLEACEPQFYMTAVRTHGELSQRELEAATCSNAGLIEYTCGLCGDMWTQVIPAGHNYVDDICSFCGKTKPIAEGVLTDTAWWELTGSHLRIFGAGELPDFPEFYAIPWHPYQNMILSAAVEEGITYIGKSTFRDCIQLAEVSLPDSVTSMGQCVFQGCSSLQKVDLPKNLEELPGWSFYLCENLKSITVPEDVTTIGMCAFYDCTSLETAQLPDSITYISDYAFSGCENMKINKLPGNLEVIGDNGFSYCYALTELFFPASVTSIGDSAFIWCDSIETITFTGNAPNMFSQTFSYVSAVAYYPQNNPTWLEAVRSPHIHLDWQTTEDKQLLGDIDCSGAVDSEDVIALLLHVTMPDIFTLTAGVTADFTGDNRVDSEDVIALLLHVTMPDVFPLLN